VLPLALDGPGRVRARRALRSLPPEAADVFAAETSRRGAGRAGPWLGALAEVGDAGLASLDRFARTPAFGPAAVDALGRSRSESAADVLARLAARSSLSRAAFAALAERTRRGDPSAANRLLSLAREGHARVALDALASCGETARDALAEALSDARLRRAAAAAISRCGDPALARLLAVRAGRRAAS
jgi:hypothetical protein